VAELGVALRRMWATPVDGLPLRRFHPAEARDFVYAGLSSRDRPGGVVGDAADVCLRHLEQPPQDFGKPVLGHGDANLANYLWDGDRFRVVDFEDGGVSDMEYELGFLLEHLSSRSTDWSPLLDACAPDEQRLRSARIISAAHWLLLLLPGQPAAMRNPPSALAQQAQRILSLARS
jgi:aminoglycoside phosphotransferase (APT) family kinase protein